MRDPMIGGVVEFSGTKSVNSTTTQDSGPNGAREP
jgi:hypothetical protein